jgi:hypothetical protein
VLCLAGTACVKPNDPGVRVDSVAADIVFGVEEPAVGAVPPPTADVYDPNSGVTDVGLNVPFRNKIPDRFKNVAFGVTPEEAAAGACPDAPVGSAPSEVAPENAKGLPGEGLYRFKVRGTQTFTVNGQDIKTPISAFEPRIIRAVEKPEDTRWTYEMVSPNGDGGVKVTSFDVNTKPTQRQVNPPYVGENPVRAGEPNVGVTVTRIQYYDGNGNQQGEFNPATPLVYLPLPVLTGEGFNSVGVDPKSGQTIRITGEVKTRQSVDACGSLVDGWLVSLDITDSEGGPRTEEVVISTGMGGLLTSDRIQQTIVGPTASQTIDLTYSLGQVTPSTVPDSNQ